MSMASVRNKPSRNGFDLSQKINFTAKVGQLLPVWWQPLLPGDDVNIDLSTFIRTQPLNTAAFARMKGYYDFYFVPYSQMWSHFDTVFTQMFDNPQHALGPLYSDSLATTDFPYFSFSQVADYLHGLSAAQDMFGFSRARNSARLLSYLGYGNFDVYCSDEDVDGTDYASNPRLFNCKFNPFALFAYQKIYSDYYRYTQWEASNAASFNIDYAGGDNDYMAMDFSVDGFSQTYNLFDLRYCNWQRDLLHGTIPQAQYGEASVVAVSGNPVVNTTVSSSANTTVNGSSVQIALNGSDARGFVAGYSSSGNRLGSANPAGLSDLPTDYTAGTFNVTGLAAQTLIDNNASSVVSNLDTFRLSILELRKAEAAQKWKEVSLAAESDYKSQIQSHWNVNVSKYKSGICEYLGGTSVNLSINEVVNNNITGDNAADIAGKGTMSGNGHVNYNSADQVGIIMCIFHALPMLDYVTDAPHFGNLLVDAADFPIPEFDSVGMELVPALRAGNPLAFNAPFSESLYFGYAPRYFDWKTSLDRSMGAFASTLKSWIIPFGDSDIKSSQDPQLPNTSNVESGSVNSSFFKVSPRTVDSLFAVNADSTVETDHFLCSSFFNVNIVRSLDVNGLPY